MAPVTAPAAPGWARSSGELYPVRLGEHPSFDPWSGEREPQFEVQAFSVGDPTRPPIPLRHQRIGSDASPATPRTVIVAPGVAVSAQEYTERYEDVDIERFRLLMPPDVFKVWVRFIGLIAGVEDLDVNEITQNVE